MDPIKSYSGKCADPVARYQPEALQTTGNTAIVHNCRRQLRSRWPDGAGALVEADHGVGAFTSVEAQTKSGVTLFLINRK